MSRMAVIFPGIGYHPDKPLLYYGRKLARSLDYEIVEVVYGGFPPDIKGNTEKMQQAFRSALAQAETILAGIDFTQYEKILFISKSVGTAVAAAYAEKYGVRADHIYFTPVPESFRFMKQKGIVFHGTADPWADTEAVKQGCAKLGLPLYITEGADHSIETGDVDRDLEILREMIRHCGEYLRDVLRLV